MVSLAAELKQYAEAADRMALPPEAVRKANELEKLARRVRHRLNDRCSGSGLIDYLHSGRPGLG